MSGTIDLLIPCQIREPGQGKNTAALSESSHVT